MLQLGSVSFPFPQDGYVRVAKPRAAASSGRWWLGCDFSIGLRLRWVWQVMLVELGRTAAGFKAVTSFPCLECVDCF